MKQVSAFLALLAVVFIMTALIVIACVFIPGAPPSPVLFLFPMAAMCSMFVALILEAWSNGKVKP